MKKSSTPIKKLRLDDSTEGISAPWQAWWHAEKKRKFYINTLTRESVWEHPGNTERSDESERMEVDVPIKRSSRSENSEEAPRKRRKDDAPIVVEASGSNEKEICASTPWISSPYFRYPYKAVAIFDTSSLLHEVKVLDIAVKHYILCVIPYAVLTEIDGLKHNPETRNSAMRITRKIKELTESHPYFLRLETSSEEKIEIPNYIQDRSMKDDAILKCALRTKLEALSIIAHLSPELTPQSIIFVTDDVALGNKAMAHKIVSEPVNKFLAAIYGIEIENTIKSTPKTEYRREEMKPVKPAKPTKPMNSYRVSTERWKQKKQEAVLKEQRELDSWIRSMSGPSTPSTSKSEPVRNSSNRPAIPLEDEVEHRELRPKVYRSYVEPRPKSTPRSLATPSRPRPQMPLSLSDEEGCSEMDCS